LNRIFEVFGLGISLLCIRLLTLKLKRSPY